MKENIGRTDRLIRALLGLVFIYLGWVVSVWFYVLAVICIGTAISGWCGLYSLLKINTCKIKDTKNKSKSFKK